MEALYKNLRNNEKERIMRCPDCGTECSADRANYWAQGNPDYEFECPDCGCLMDIVIKQVIFKSI